MIVQCAGRKYRAHAAGQEYTGHCSIAKLPYHRLYPWSNSTALGRVRYYTNTSQNYRSMVYCSRWVSMQAKSGFLGVIFIAVGWRTRRWELLRYRLKAYFFCLYTSSDNWERNMQKWNSNNRDCKKETIEIWMWLRRSCGVKLREAECFVTTH